MFCRWKTYYLSIRSRDYPYFIRIFTSFLQRQEPLVTQTSLLSTSSNESETNKWQLLVNISCHLETEYFDLFEKK